MRCVSHGREGRVASARLIPRRKRARNGKKNKRTNTAEGGKKSPYFSLFHFQGTPVTCLVEVILLLSTGKQGRVVGEEEEKRERERKREIPPQFLLDERLTP